MQRCASCGAENRDVARYCATCGKRLTENASALSAPPQAAGTPATQPKEAVQPRLHAGSDGVLSEQEEASKEVEPSTRSEAGAVPTGATAPADAGTDEVAGSEAGPAGSAQELSSAAPDITCEQEQDSPSSPAKPTSDPDEGAVAAQPAADFTKSQDATSAGAPELPPLQPGVLVAGRWQITAFQETAEGRNTYSALDLAACPMCGAIVDADEDYCSECGVQVLQAGPTPTVMLHEGASAEALAEFGPSVVRDSDRSYVAIAAVPVAGDPAAPPAPRPLALAVGYASNCGLVRELDEDSVFVFTLAGVFESRVGPSLGLFIVADGMGGHEGGELASREAVRNIAETLIDSVLLPAFKRALDGGGDAVKERVQRAVVDANTAVYRMAADQGIDAGTTVTLAVVVEGEAHIANVGDSRTFLFRDGTLRQVTQDHSLVGSLVRAGALQPEEIYTHPQRNVVYRSLGASVKVTVDQFYELLQSGDALVLCCDGVWETVRPEGIEEVLLAVTDPQAACNELVRRGNAAGGDDNLSVIVVRVNS